MDFRGVKKIWPYLFLARTFDLVISQCHQIQFEILGLWICLEQNLFTKNPRSGLVTMYGLQTSMNMTFLFLGIKKNYHFVMKGILNYQLRFIWWMNVLIINDCFMIFAERKKNCISSRIPNEKLLSHKNEVKFHLAFCN